MTGSSNDCNPDPSIGVWLSHSERARAERFHQTSRADFVHSRWLIRQTLAAATGHPVEYCRPVADRPVASSSPPGWSLSLSHSHGLVACVASTASGVGIDIEPHSRHRQWHKVVRRWFSDREQQWLLANDRVEDFLYAWTLKEAWLKATGRGIAGNLQTLEVLGDGQLLGDQPDRDWQASVGTFDGFTVAAVFHADHPEPPTSALLEPTQGCESLASRALAANPVRWHVHRAIRHSDHLIQTREARS